MPIRRADSGMSCRHRLGSVEKALEWVDEVTKVVPDPASGPVRIRGALRLCREASGVFQLGPIEPSGRRATCHHNFFNQMS
jgi:hypothetical protein